LIPHKNSTEIIFTKLNKIFAFDICNLYACMKFKMHHWLFKKSFFVIFFCLSHNALD